MIEIIKYETQDKFIKRRINQVVYSDSKNVKNIQIQGI